MMSLITGVHRDIWYVCSLMRSFRGTVYGFFRLLCVEEGVVGQERD